jgi:hypothetical protein
LRTAWEHRPDGGVSPRNPDPRASPIRTPTTATSRRARPRSASWFFRSIQAGQGIYLLDAHERLRRHVAIRGLFPASQSHLCPVSAGQHRTSERKPHGCGRLFDSFPCRKGGSTRKWRWGAYVAANFRRARVCIGASPLRVTTLASPKGAFRGPSASTRKTAPAQSLNSLRSEQKLATG